MSQFDQAPCIKCHKEVTLNATGICKECRTNPCNWCGEPTTSKKKPPECIICHKRSQKTKNELRQRRMAN